jgi:activating signal cointegrator 1
VKALSLWQPWASAIALGRKHIETRHWSTSYRGPIAIHAAKRWTPDERDMHEREFKAGRMPARLPLGAIVAVARLYAILRTEDLRHALTEDERFWGNYGDGRFGWMLDGIKPLERPLPFKGAQGIFEVPDHLLGELAPEPEAMLL